ncbi:flagellar protein FlaG [Succinimonas amylolytica]|uniref:flagellar protein FlaG n=1 Tax=Succinimonas amylolytica TaxID=83769 RepID=UPI00037CE883|nr:flagellar protein FlaG [Succinimonas amylolytica]
MIDAVVNSSADFLAKGKIQNSPAAEVNHAVSTETNSKTSKATEVQSQARAVNDKDKVTGTLVEEQKKAAELEKEAKLKELAQEEAEEDGGIKTQEELDKMAEAMSQLIPGYGLSFAMDKDLNEVVVTVTNKTTDEVIRQIPREEFLTIAKKFNELLQEFSGKTSDEDLKGVFMDSHA